MAYLNASRRKNIVSIAYAGRIAIASDAGCARDGVGRRQCDAARVDSYGVLNPILNPSQTTNFRNWQFQRWKEQTRWRRLNDVDGGVSILGLCYYSENFLYFPSWDNSTQLGFNATHGLFK